MFQLPADNNNILLETVCKACSQNPTFVKEAESQIQQLEIQPGYCFNLLVCLCYFFFFLNFTIYFLILYRQL
jgi:hypothetical protein